MRVYRQEASLVALRNLLRLSKSLSLFSSQFIVLLLQCLNYRLDLHTLFLLELNRPYILQYIDQKLFPLAECSPELLVGLILQRIGG